MMTDGERLVWAAAFAIAIEHNDDGATAVKIAAQTVQKLRAVADVPAVVSHHFTVDERDFLDEIARAP